MNSQIKAARTVATNGAGYAAIQFGSGIVAGNPKCCFVCRQPIHEGERWIKYTSPLDPEFGTYSFIIHAHCDGKGT